MSQQFTWINTADSYFMYVRFRINVMMCIKLLSISVFRHLSTMSLVTFYSILFVAQQCSSEQTVLSFLRANINWGKNAQLPASKTKASFCLHRVSQTSDPFCKAAKYTAICASKTTLLPTACHAIPKGYKALFPAVTKNIRGKKTGGTMLNKPQHRTEAMAAPTQKLDTHKNLWCMTRHITLSTLLSLFFCFFFFFCIYTFFGTHFDIKTCRDSQAGLKALFFFFQGANQIMSFLHNLSLVCCWLHSHNLLWVFRDQ